MSRGLSDWELWLLYLPFCQHSQGKRHQGSLRCGPPQLQPGMLWAVVGCGPSVGRGAEIAGAAFPEVQLLREPGWAWTKPAEGGEPH